MKKYVYRIIEIGSFGFCEKGYIGYMDGARGPWPPKFSRNLLIPFDQKGVFSNIFLYPLHVGPPKVIFMKMASP